MRRAAVEPRPRPVLEPSQSIRSGFLSLKSAFAFAAALAVASPLAAQTSEGPQPYPMPPPIPAPRDVAYPGVLKLEIDATDVERRIFRINQTIPIAGGGPVTLLYPQWV